MRHPAATPRFQCRFSARSSSGPIRKTPRLAAGLNPAELDWIAGHIKALAQSGIAIIVVEHLMGFIEQITDRVIVMNAGKEIFEGTLAVAVKVPQVIEVFLGGEHAA